MSWWNAKYKNAHDEYEITFGSKYREKTKIVEKVCKAIIDKTVQSEDDIAIVRHGRWLDNEFYMFCSVCGMQWYYCDNETQDFKFCPHCGCKMDGDDDAIKAVKAFMAKQEG